MSKWLSDDEIGCLEFQSAYSKQLFEQAKEANRLREGLEEIRNHAIQMRNKNAKNYERTLDPTYSDAEQIFEGFADDIGELLEGEK